MHLLGDLPCLLRWLQSAAAVAVAGGARALRGLQLLWALAQAAAAAAGARILHGLQLLWALAQGAGAAAGAGIWRGLRLLLTLAKVGLQLACGVAAVSVFVYLLRWSPTRPWRRALHWCQMEWDRQL